MDKESQDRLNTISAKELSELTEDDKGFLFGRRTYLGPRGQKKFGALLKEMEIERGVGKPEKKVKEEAKKKEAAKKAPKAQVKKEPEVKKAPESGTGPENPFSSDQDEDDEDEDAGSPSDSDEDEDEDEDDKALG